MESTTTLSVIILGMVLGLRHALDPDHIIAVSTIVSDSRNPLKSIWIGISWGIGHTTTLFILGIVVIAVGVAIPDRLALFFEMLVGILLVILGIQVLWKIRQGRLHRHEHRHQKDNHQHFHSHSNAPSHRHPNANNWLRELKPSFRGKSYVIGLFHGLAGSAALMVLVLTTIENPVTGLIYVAIFGIGSMIGMGTVTIILSLPFSISASVPLFNRLVHITAGIGSIFFGSLLVYQILFQEHLLG